MKNFNKMKRAYFFILFISVGFTAKAQDLPVFSQYLQNTYYLSPAAIGIKPCKEAILTDRHQWTGIKNAPNTQSLGLYSRLNLFKNNPKIGHNGIGASFYTDKNGPTSAMRVQLAFSHHLTLYKKRRKNDFLNMAFGFAVSGFQNKLDESELLPGNISDPLFTGTSESITSLNADAAVLFYTEKFTLGFTGANLLPSARTQKGSVNIINRHYFGFAAYSFRNRKGAGVEPSVVYKRAYKTQQADVNMKIYFNEVFNTGFSYRHNLDSGAGQSLSAAILFGLQFENFAFGYAYDYSLGQIGRHNFGSHNFKIGYRVCDNRKNCPAYL